MNLRHGMRGRILALITLLLLAMSLPTVGCTEETSAAGTQSTAARNFIATAQAETTLREFFRAWVAKDGAATEALLTESRQQDSSWGAGHMIE